MIGHIISLAVPLAGIICVILFQLAPDHKPTRSDTSAKSQGSDHRQDRRQP